jgi:ABC-type Zn2+ transport system substrate-binding protein/surface adhesin
MRFKLNLKSPPRRLQAAKSLYSDIEITPKDEEEFIENVAQKIHEYELDTAAILLLESSKPLVWVGGEMGRFFISPFAPIISEKWGITSEKFFQVFEKRENIEKLLKRLEQLTQEEDDKAREAKRSAKEKKEAERKAAEAEGWEQSQAEKTGLRKRLHI